MVAPINWFGHNIIITYIHGNTETTYSAGMHDSARAISRLAEVVTDPEATLVGLSCPVDFLAEMAYGRSDVLEQINKIIPAMV